MFRTTNRTTNRIIVPLGVAGAFGFPWADFGSPFAPLGCRFALFGMPLGSFGPPWGALGCLGVPVGRPRLGVPSGAFWAAFWGPFGRLGVPWRAFGGPLGRLGMPWGCLGAFSWISLKIGHHFDQYKRLMERTDINRYTHVFLVCVCVFVVLSSSMCLSTRGMRKNMPGMHTR